MQNKKSYAVYAFLLFAPFSLAVGGPSSATLQGTVTSATGDPVAGIPVTITDSATGITVRFVSTDRHGNYSAPDLLPGIYKVTIEQRGYQIYGAENVVLGPGQLRILNPKLPSTQNEDAPAIQIGPSPAETQSGALRSVVDLERQWNDTPSMDKVPSPFPRLTTAPGVQGNGHGLVLAGTGRSLQSWAIDGVTDDVTGIFYGIPNYFEAVSVTSASPGPEAARPTGFDMISKRGSTTFHGDLYVRYGSSKFDSRPYFSTQKDNYALDELGGQAGGALFPQRTYFFGGWMHQSNPYAMELFADVPTNLMRSRDFSQYLNAQTSPTGQAVVVRDPRNNAPFPNNLIPASRVNTVATNILNNYLPAPNLGGANTFVQNYAWSHRYGPGVYRGNWPFLRLDHKLFDENNLMFRFTESAFTSVAPGSIGETLNSTQGVKYKNFLLSDTWAVSSRVVNRASIGVNVNLVRQGQGVGNAEPLQGSSVLTTMGIQGTNLNGYTTVGFPPITISGITGLSTVYPGGYTNNIAQNDHIVTLEDAVTWSIRRHSIQLGIQGMHYNWLLGAVPQTNWGSFSFTGQFSGIGFADFLLGLPATSTRLLNPKLNARILQNTAGAYMSDSFRVTSRLTVDYGVRWDYFGSPRYEDGYMYTWNPTTGVVIVAPGTISSVSPLYPKNIQVSVGPVAPQAKITNIRPRLSAAYRLTDALVIRGGYSDFTVPDGYGPSGLINDPNGPYRLTETYVNSISSNGVVAYTMPRPFPGTLSSTLISSQSITALPVHAEEGVIRQYHLTVERAFRGIDFRASYIGSRGSSMNYSLNINKPPASTLPFSVSRLPYPQFNQTWVTRTDGKWRYDSLQMDVSKPLGGIVFDSNFTWANNTSNYANTYDPYHVTDHWTRDASDRRLYFVASANWAIPTGKGKRWFTDAGPMVNRVISNWTLQAISTFASGQYYSPLFTGPDPANASPGFVTALPDCIGDPNSGARTRNQWFNPAAFAVPSPAAGRYGNCGMNTLEGYPIHVAHASLAKRFALNERLTAVFTVQVSNVTNTPHFTIPNANISLPGAGRFTASSTVPDYNPEHQGSRQLDLKFRLQW
jgi:hypothetical protein